MTKIKFCGMRRPEDIAAANEIKPEYIGFVLAPQFWRHISRETARALKAALSPDIQAVGVFVDNPFEEVLSYLQSDIIDIAQLHGQEDDEFIRRLQSESGKKVIKAFKITSAGDLERACGSPADMVLLDSGTGTGELFDHSLIRGFGRDYFLAGGLDPHNVGAALRNLTPYAVDVSSGIETEKLKDKEKMRAFAQAVRSRSI